MSHGHLDYFQTHLLEVGLTQKPGVHGTMNVHNCWFDLFYFVMCETHMDKNSLK